MQCLDRGNLASWIDARRNSLNLQSGSIYVQIGLIFVRMKESSELRKTGGGGACIEMGRIWFVHVHTS